MAVHKQGAPGALMRRADGGFPLWKFTDRWLCWRIPGLSSFHTACLVQFVVGYILDMHYSFHLTPRTSKYVRKPLQGEQITVFGQIGKSGALMVPSTPIILEI